MIDLKEYPILTTKIDEREWRYFLVLGANKIIKRKRFKPKNDLLNSIYRIHKLIVEQTYLENLKINEDAIFEYIVKIEERIKQSKDNNQMKDVLLLESRLLHLYNNYIISGHFYPIITMNDSQGRLFINPLYTWKPNWIKHLFITFQFFIPESNKKYISFDMNGLTLRGLLNYIYTETKDEYYKKLSYYDGDIYELIYNECGIADYLYYNKTYTRNEFKTKIIAYMFGKKDEMLDSICLKSPLLNVIKKYSIVLGHDLINQYSILWFLYILYEIFIKCENGKICIPFLNNDGGYMMIKKSTFNKIKKFFPFLRLSEW